MAFLSQKDLELIGFAKIGEHVLISDKASIYNPSKISIGSYVTIDDFCLLSSGKEGIEIGSFIHLSCYVTLLGHAKITLHDFVSIGIKSTILSSTSDFSGEFIPSLEVFENFIKLNDGISKTILAEVIFETHSQLGANSIILPGVKIGVGTVIGAMSIVNKDLKPWGIYLGIPARLVKNRSKYAYRNMEELK